MSRDDEDSYEADPAYWRERLGDAVAAGMAECDREREQILIAAALKEARARERRTLTDGGRE